MEAGTQASVPSSSKWMVSSTTTTLPRALGGDGGWAQRQQTVPRGLSTPTHTEPLLSRGSESRVIRGSQSLGRQGGAGAWS